MLDNQEYRLLKKESSYNLQVGNIIIEMQYSNNKNINECIFNILKQKNKMV